MDDTSNHSTVAIGGTPRVLPMPSQRVQKSETKQMANEIKKVMEQIGILAAHAIANGYSAAMAKHGASFTIGVAELTEGKVCEHINAFTLAIFIGAKDDCASLAYQINSLVQDYMEGDDLEEEEKTNPEKIH